MACRGVYFALTKQQESQLLAARGDDEVMSVMEAIEEQWDEKWLQEVDKAWDAIHRCLTDGTLSCEPKSDLHKCVLGGRRLCEGDDYIVSFLSAYEVKVVAVALKNIDEAWMRRKYERIDKDEYYPVEWKDAEERRSWFEQDFEYTWEYMKAVKEFYEKAGDHNRVIVFTVDQ